MSTNDKIMSFEDIPVDKKEETPEKQDTRKDVLSSVEKLRTKNAIVDQVEYLIKTCKNEKELLELRNKVIATEYSGLKKSDLLEELDKRVSERISSTIREASLLDERKTELNNMKLGAVICVVIGFFLTGRFRFAFPIAIVIAVGAYIASDARKNYQASVNAKRELQKYLDAGYQLKL